jgi:hypothetical protein
MKIFFTQFLLIICCLTTISCDAHLRLKSEVIGQVPSIQCLKGAIGLVPSLSYDELTNYKPEVHRVLEEANVIRMTWNYKDYPMWVLLALEKCKDGTQRTAIVLNYTVPNSFKEEVKKEFHNLTSTLASVLEEKCHMKDFVVSLKQKTIISECGN